MANRRAERTAIIDGAEQRLEVPGGDDDLPVVEAVGWAPMAGGWGLVRIWVQGLEVLDVEALASHPIKSEDVPQHLTMSSVALFQQAVKNRKGRRS